MWLRSPPPAPSRGRSRTRRRGTPGSPRRESGWQRGPSDLCRAGQAVEARPRLRLPEVRADERLRAVEKRLLDLDPDGQPRRAALLDLVAREDRRVARELGAAVHPQRLVEAGDEEEQAGPPGRTMLRSESTSLFPFASAKTSRFSSSTSTKPGGPPRGETSQRPSASLVATGRRRPGDELSAVRIEAVDDLVRGDLRRPAVGLDELVHGADDVAKAGRALGSAHACIIARAAPESHVRAAPA